MIIYTLFVLPKGAPPVDTVWQLKDRLTTVVQRFGADWRARPQGHQAAQQHACTHGLHTARNVPGCEIDFSPSGSVTWRFRLDALTDEYYLHVRNGLTWEVFRHGGPHPVRVAGMAEQELHDLNPVQFRALVNAAQTILQNYAEQYMGRRPPRQAPPVRTFSEKLSIGVLVCAGLAVALVVLCGGGIAFLMVV